MNKPVKIIEIVVFTAILCKVFLTAILTTMSSFCEFYEYKYPDLTERINNNPIYRNTLFTYAGFDTGYGFFAPNVSSNFVIISQNSNKSYISDDLLKTNEGKMRFMNANDIFFKNFKKEKNTEHEKDQIAVNKIILKRINTVFEEKYNSKFKTSVYLYEHPKLEDMASRKEHLIKIDETP